MRKNILLKVLILGVMFGITVFLNGTAKTGKTPNKKKNRKIAIFLRES